MFSLATLFAIMMAPAIAALMTSLVVRLFEQRTFEQKFDTERSLFRSDLAKSEVS
ncbi:hypothetical protein [Thalassotalea euphylliae]|uniref:hypothetical protein n=1 Tax=Thalassotalea euphylliae TaxID=1655234 RepID=UPI0015F29739|nr:hypothetical protein [Thalassotalea euphylliae]